MNTTIPTEQKMREAAVFKCNAGKRGPDTWRMLLDTIKCESVRVSAASIVWWDFFGQRVSTDRWPHLDDLLIQYRLMPPADLRDVAAALVALGYPEWMALRRAKVIASNVIGAK